MTAAMEAETPGFTLKTPSVTARPSLYVRETSGLVRTVGPRTALFANLVGMGIIVNYFWIVFASAGYPNANLVTTVGIGVLINLGVGYVYWMLSSSMPRSGGDYVFLGRIFHPSIGLGTNLLFTVVFVTWAGYFAYYTAFYGIPTMLAAFTVAGGGSSALTMANTILASHVDQFLISFFILLLVVLVSLLPTKWIFRTVVGIFAVSALIYIIMLATLLSTSQATFVADWNAANTAGNSYQTLAASASTTTITLGGTFLGIVYTMLSFIGYANSSYYGGEIRGNPTRTQGLAIFGAPLIFAALIAALYAATYVTFGRNFLIGVSINYVTPGSTLTSIPSPLFLVAYILHGDPWLAGFLAFGLILTFFGFALVYFIVPTRNLFSWSFDRILPTAFARVSRNGVPWVAVILLAVASFIVVYFGVYSTIFSYLSYSNFGFWLAVGLVCLGGALFPFLRPQLFKSSPRIVQARIGRVPIITIVGIASWIAAWFVSYAASTASYVEPSGAYSYAYLLFLPIVFVVGVVIYWISRAIQMSRGIPMDLINKELPPE